MSKDWNFLPRGAVQRARGGPAQGRGFTLDGIFGPAFIRASRIVPGTPKDLAAKLDEFLVASQLLQPVRRGLSVLQYRPAVDWTSQLARAASFSSRKHYIAAAKSVEVRLEAVDDSRTMVEFTLDPGTRNDSISTRNVISLFLTRIASKTCSKGFTLTLKRGTCSGRA